MKKFPYKAYTKTENYIAIIAPTVVLIFVNLLFGDGDKDKDKDLLLIINVFNTALALVPISMIIKIIFGLKSPILKINKEYSIIPVGLFFPTKYIKVYHSQIIEVKLWSKSWNGSRRDYGTYLITNNLKVKLSAKLLGGNACHSEIVNIIRTNIPKSCKVEKAKDFKKMTREQLIVLVIIQLLIVLGILYMKFR